MCFHLVLCCHLIKTMSGLLIFVTRDIEDRPVELSSDATIRDIINQMPDKDIPPTNKRIYYQNKVQPEGELLADLGICNESRVEYRPYITLKVTDDDIHDHVGYFEDDPKYQSGGEWDISYWDTSSVTDMSELFSDSNINQPLNWDTSKVEDMTLMFYACRNFKQPINWDTTNLLHMCGMFRKARYEQSHNIKTIHEK